MSELTPESLQQLVAEWRKKLAPKPHEAAILVFHPTLRPRLEREDALAKEKMNLPFHSSFSLLIGLRLEEDAECPRDQVVVVPHSQVNYYDQARRWVGPFMAANAAAKLEDAEKRYEVLYQPGSIPLALPERKVPPYRLKKDEG